jgi:hypothetical protein
MARRREMWAVRHAYVMAIYDYRDARATISQSPTERGRRRKISSSVTTRA